jgi:alpha-mannosidase
MGGETFEVAKLKSSYPKLSAHPVGQWIPNIYKDRIAQFYSGGQYEGKNLRAYVPIYC